MPDTPETSKPEGGLTAPLDIPNIPGMVSTMPQSLDWENITNIWQAIEHARQTREPQEWDAVTNAVGESLRAWRKKETSVNDQLQVYNLIHRHAMLKPEGSEDRQKLLDKLQKMKEQFPPAVQRSIERDDQRIEVDKGTRDTLKSRADSMKPGEEPVSGRWMDDTKAQLNAKVQSSAMPRVKVAAPRVRFIDSLLRQLEGIKQGDFESYHPDVKSRIKKFGTDQEHEQDVVQRQLKIQDERLTGIKDPKRRAPIMKRLADRRAYMNSLPDDSPELKQVMGEIDALIRRLTGATTEAGKKKIQEIMSKLKEQIKTPDELKARQDDYADKLKYDALLWLVTNVSHPIKARPSHAPGASRGPSQAASPVGKMPYVPPQPGEIWQVPKPPPAKFKKGPKNLLSRASAEEDPMSQRPYGKASASECHIFLSMIHESKFTQAKAFIEDPYVVSEGSLVTLRNIADTPELNGLKGRVRSFSEESGNTVIVDLFKNDAVADSAVKVSFYEAKPYLL